MIYKKSKKSRKRKGVALTQTQSVTQAPYFNHTLNSRLKFLYFIRLLLPLLDQESINVKFLDISTQIDLPAQAPETLNLPPFK
jgi:hypothetical protein